MSDLIQMPHAAVLPVIRSAVTPGTGWELFNPLSLDPLVYFDALGGSMLDSGGAAASHGDTVAVLDDLAESSVALVLPGVAYNYASVPDSVALDITGDLDLRAKITLESFTPAADGDLIAKYITTGNQRAFRLLVNTSGQLHFIHSPTGTGFSGNTATSSVALPTDNLTLWVRAIKSESLKNVTFFTSTDGENWSQLGVPQSITSGTTFSSSAFLEVGSNNSGINPGFSHVIHRVQIFASTDGTDKRLDIDFTTPAAGATSFTASTGQTVTINQSGDYPARIGGTSYAAQSTDSLRPVALTEAGLYLPGVVGNYASVPDEAALDITGDLTVEFSGALVDWTPGTQTSVCGKWESSGQRSYLMTLSSSGRLQLILSANGISTTSFTATADISHANGEVGFIRARYDKSAGAVDFEESSDGSSWSAIGTQVVVSSVTIHVGTSVVEIGEHESSVPNNGTFQSVKIWDNAAASGDPVLDIDFTNPSDAHGATSITAETGQPVTINKSGDDPATLIRHPVARFDGSDDYLSGTFGSTLTGGWMFAVFEVLGSGGGSTARVFSVSDGVNADGGNNACAIYSYENTDLATRYSSVDRITFASGYDGRLIHDVLLADGDQRAYRNGVAGTPTSVSMASFASTDFAIGARSGSGVGTLNAAIDLHHLSLYPASLTAAEATKIRNYLNNRYNVY